MQHRKETKEGKYCKYHEQGVINTDKKKEKKKIYKNKREVIIKSNMLYRDKFNLSM